MVSTVKVFNITLPRKDDLCCAILKIMNSENRPMVYSKYCEYKLKCRQFLQEIPQAMAAPITNRKLLENGNSIYVMIDKDFYGSCTFRDHCDALDTQVVDLLDPIPAYVYKTCLLYTMEQRLAPQWNKVGLYLVEGQDFLSSTGNVNAMMLNIKNICNNSAQLHVEAFNLKIPFLRLNTVRPLQHELQAPVRVLPSLKVANILNISKEINKKYLFKNYEDLRGYWKNMHGYILPDYEEGCLFYDVEFFYFKSNIFVYPETCLTSGPPQTLLLTTDPVSKIYKFIGDLKARVAKLCNQQLDVCSENTYQGTILPYSPMLPKIDRYSICDTGYGTGLRKISNISRTFDTCNIPTKRSRLSLPGINNSSMGKTEINYDIVISSTCSTNNCDKLFKITGLSTIYSTDSAVASKSLKQEDKSKSHYFKQEEQISGDKSFLELMDEKEEKVDKKSLKEKLLKNF
ncbi:hypothetical protein PUN28_005212 [Cardiocondyla obscurior]|uniref:DUF4708 domain-containing protein n=2 Tax=Cardiocondyla obscurior TaxID=286306 RepID=A0AAW2GGD5_9HYME